MTELCTDGGRELEKIVIILARLSLLARHFDYFRVPVHEFPKDSTVFF